MENNSKVKENSWKDINKVECEEASLCNMCSWAEAN